MCSNFNLLISKLVSCAVIKYAFQMVNVPKIG